MEEEVEGRVDDADGGPASVPPARGRWLGAVEVEGHAPDGVAGPRRISAAVCAVGALYVVPLLWILWVLAVRRGPAARFERSYAWAALLFQVEALVVISVLALPFVLDGGRTVGLLVLPGVAAAAAGFVSVYAAVCALVGSAFLWPTVPRRTSPPGR